MDMWIEKNGEKIFAQDAQNESLAVIAAKGCGNFAPDVEDEWVSDEQVTCLNCKYRRWIAQGFSCIYHRRHQ